MTETGIKCSTCQSDIKGKYCQECGTPAELKRIDAHYLLHEIEHIFHVERGFIYTIKSLLTSPGDSVRQFIGENRTKLVKPVIFIIVTSLMYSILTHYFQIEDGYVQSNVNSKNPVELLFKWVQDNYGYANILMGATIALWLMIFFRKSSYNYFEILILLCYVMGIGMLIYGVFGIIEVVTEIKLMKAASMFSLIYCIWAIGHFFDKKKATSYLKALVAYLLGMMLFFGLLFIIGKLIEYSSIK